MRRIFAILRQLTLAEVFGDTAIIAILFLMLAVTLAPGTH